MKIDFHTHILPGIDDGSDSAETTVKMLQMLAAQQVSHIVLTPHYYSHQKPIKEFVDRRAAAFQKIADIPHTPQLHLGAEVYFTDYLFNNKDLSPLCIDNSNVMLLELPYNKTIDDGMLDKIDRLISEYAIVPVIAHVERYPDLIRQNGMLDRLLNTGCVLQANLSSFAAFGKRRLISLVKDGYIGAVGTDCHNPDTRPPDYNTGYQRLTKAVPQELLSAIQHSMLHLLKDE